jgi:Arc/MetJ family transcription regulator
MLDLMEFGTMRTTIVIDDDLFETAQRFTGEKEKSAVIRAAVKGYVQREAARRLARLGGSAPDIKPIPRRQSEPA